MSPSVAALIFAAGILGLFALDREARGGTSRALWLPLVWLLIAGSRNIGEWLQMGATVEAGDQYLEGNPVDRNVLALLVATGLVILLSRRHRVLAILKANPAIVLYFGYCALSLLWSDYPYVGFKRWIRASGDLVMVLIVLSDSDPLAAIRRLVGRAAFLLIPISVLLIRYYPDYGRGYSYWDGGVSWTGVATTKNSLGMICMICGLGCLWRILAIWRDYRGISRTRHMMAQGTVLAMILWLLWVANSMTSLACFAIAAAVMVAASFRVIRRRPALVHLLVAAVVCVAMSVLFLNLSSGTLQSMGRDSSLTGRTEIWNVVLRFTVSPLFGAGFESFWLGPRFQQIRSVLTGLNQCHNGYLEVYMNLGLLGLTFLAGVMFTGYRHVMFAIRRQPETGALRLAYFVVGVIYNFTEAGVKMMSPVWIFFLFSIIALPKVVSKETEPLVASNALVPKWSQAHTY